MIVKYSALLRSRYEHYSPFLNVGYLDTATGTSRPSWTSPAPTAGTTACCWSTTSRASSSRRRRRADQHAPGQRQRAGPGRRSRDTRSRCALQRARGAAGRRPSAIWATHLCGQAAAARAGNGSPAAPPSTAAAAPSTCRSPSPATRSISSRRTRSTPAACVIAYRMEQDGKAPRSARRSRRRS